MVLHKSKEFKKKAEDFLKSRKNANNLVELIEGLNDPTTAYVSNVLALDLVFTKLLSRGDLSPLSSDNKDSVETKYKDWLKENYDVCFSKLIQVVIHGKKYVLQNQTLSTIFKLIAEEGKHPVENEIHRKSYYFPVYRLRQLYSALLQSEKKIKKLAPKLEEMFSSFLDVVYFSWIALAGSVEDIADPTERVIKNTLLLIDQLPTAKTEEKQLLKATQEPDSEESMLCFTKGKKKFKADMDHLRSAVSKVWTAIRNWPHTPSTKLHLLTTLNERILHNLERPLLLADFLVDSLDIGGPVAVLALQAIFVLVVQHNFDCSKIFKKLYALFEPNLFHTKYKARLFHLSNICFSSTHLQESLVASFIKRLALLSLKAPAPDVMIITAFIGNLIIRHPTLKRLMHGPPDTSVGWDPFLAEEPEPESTHALESSLWELKTLQSHILPMVASSVKYIDNNLPTLEWDLGERLDNDYNEMFDKAMKRKLTHATNFERPTGMSLPRGEQLLNFWSMS